FTAPVSTDVDVADCDFTLAVDAAALQGAPTVEDDSWNDLDLTVEDWDAEFNTYWTDQGLTVPVTDVNGAALGNPVVLSEGFDDIDVQNTNGDDLGEIEDFIIDSQTGSFEYAILAAGGFLGLAQAPDKVGLNGSLRHFLAVCVANRARDRLRSRRETVPADEIEFQVPEGQQPEVVASLQEELRRTWWGLARLPDEQREVVVLHLVAGLRFRQIADTLAISINTAQSRYRYGMERLRSLLNGEVKE
ncbi:MAG: sigma-70 family RNA polymerase sigma factor, partial [Phycisphaerae bacterium]|nr:sigma-70 family RNA polymerase sigma factor [Phycisphaerae bacterium]